MPSHLNLLGHPPFGRLLVMAHEKDYPNSRWLCQCECGNQVVVTTGHLRSGHTQSCGCKNVERMRARLVNLLEQRFGRLTVLLYAGKDVFEKTLWLCQCDCGNQVTVTMGNLRYDVTSSCGCLLRDIATENGKKTKTHGLTGKKSFEIWIKMMERCKNVHNKDYGGRGIYVVERWHDPINFTADMGEPPEAMTLERLDNNGAYSPENCVWASRKIQSRNRRSNVMITHDGKTQCLDDWVKETGIDPTVIKRRIKSGYSSEWVFFQGGTVGKLITFQGITKRLVDWAQEVRKSPQCITVRLKLGWSVEKALYHPVRPIQMLQPIDAQPSFLFP